jgi:hypothetical protein
MNNLNQSIKKSAKMFGRIMPVFIGLILLLTLIMVHISSSFYSLIFGIHPLIDPIIGASIGSIIAGNPIESYIIGGELLNHGISLIAVTSFIVAWVTVGVFQFPAESMLLGTKFAIVRNVVAFIFSIIVAVVTVGIVGVIG